MARKRSKKRIWIFLALFGVVLAGILAVAFAGGDKGTRITVGKSERGDITSEVSATGKIYPEVEVRISSEVAGEIIELPVKEGQKVQKGDLLVRVNPDTLEAQVKQRQASLAASRAEAAQSRAQMLQTELDLNRTRELAEKGFATKEELDRARTTYEVAQASFQAANHRVERQEMELVESRDTLSKASIYAPIEGTITRLNSELGDRVVGTGQFEGTEIMRVANLENVEIRVDVSETDIVSVEIGQEADVEIDAISDKIFAGRVTEIANSAETTDERSQEQLTTFLVKVKLLEPGDEVRPGMTATADIRTRTVTDVVKVPLQAVTVRPRDEVAKAVGEETETAEGGDNGDRKENGKKRGGRDNLRRVVFVVENGVARMQPVETGIADNRSIEILSGLEADTTIVTGSYRALTRELEQDSAVTVEEPAKAGGEKPKA